MMHAKFQDYRTLGSDFLRFCPYVDNLGHVTKTIFTKFMFPLPKEASHEIWF